MNCVIACCNAIDLNDRHSRYRGIQVIDDTRNLRCPRIMETATTDAIPIQGGNWGYYGAEELPQLIAWLEGGSDAEQVSTLDVSSVCQQSYNCIAA
jgi:hypothetical protein